MDDVVETIVLEAEGPRSACRCGVVLVKATFWLACDFFLLCPHRTGGGRWGEGRGREMPHVLSGYFLPEH